MNGGAARGKDSEVVLRAEGLEKHFEAVETRQGRGKAITLFRGLDLKVRAGEMVAVVGASGTGKSSLLHLLAALDRPSAGEVWFHDQRVTGLRGAAAARFRNREIGYLWQFHYLLPEFTAAENVAMPLLAQGVAARQARAWALEWLERVGLGDRAAHRSGELSGGEQQRVSLARALIAGPSVLLADEPTGDLDEQTAEEVFELLQRLQRENGLAAVLVTHHMSMAARCDRVLRLRGGQFNEIGKDPEGRAADPLQPGG